MAQPIWITPAGSLGIIPEGIFYQQFMQVTVDPVLTVTCTATSAATNRITCNSTTGMYADLEVEFSGNVFGGINIGIRYVVLQVVSVTQFVIGVAGTTTPVSLTTATGSMTADLRQEIYYQVISGTLPAGIQCSANGLITGVPQAVASLQGVPFQVNRNVTSKFALRAYTENLVNGTLVLDRIRDRTFELTVSGNDVPDFTNPAGSLGTYYDGDQVDLQLGYTNVDPGEILTVKLINGSLPLGLTLTPTGLISGYIEPAANVNEPPGYDLEPASTVPYDFIVSAIDKNYQFTLEVSDGKSSSLRTFTIFVYNRSELTADNTTITADNTFVDASQTTERAPFLTNANPSDLGRVRSDNFFAYQFLGDDYDTADIEYLITVNEGNGLPPGLTLDPTTGWYYGFIPDNGLIEVTYSFNIQVRQVDNPAIVSQLYPFTMTIIGIDDSAVTWITDSDLGTVENGSTSILRVQAVARGGKVLNYRLKNGAFNELPQGLELLPTGEIAGRVTFNTFAIDLGFTTFDKSQSTVSGISETTFDSKYTFTVNAYADNPNQPEYAVAKINVVNGGSGYSSINPPTVTISDPIGSAAVTATLGTPVVSGGKIISIPIVDGGAGYTSTAIITITQGFGGSGAVLTVDMTQIGTVDAISVFKTFSITILRAYNYPYQNLFCLAMPPANDRQLLNNLLTNSNIFVPGYIYRPQDANFGVSTRVKYEHAYGLAPDNIDTYVSSLYLNHYWKNLILGSINTAQALDDAGNVIYEVVYSKVIDNLVNNAGQSVSKIVNLPYEIIDPGDGSTVLTQVYPNSLVNMRDQVIDVVGQISTKLPLWMTSKQPNGRVLGFTPAWVICYAQPGRSAQIAYYIEEYFAQNLNVVDFKVDRYVLDRTLSKNWDTENQRWTPQGSLTTFDFYNTSNYVDLGTVQAATNLAYDDINFRTLDQINALGGIDGLTWISIPGELPPPDTKVIITNGTKLIFVKQQDYSNYDTSDDAWQQATVLYDSNGYDQIGTDFDESYTISGGYNVVCTATAGATDRITCLDTTGMTAGDTIWFTGDVFGGVVSFNNNNQIYYILDVIDGTHFRITDTIDGTTPVNLSTDAGNMNAVWGNYRMGIYEITIVAGATASDPSTVQLSLLQQTAPNDYLKVTQGFFYNTAQLYRPTVPGAALTVINWQPLITAITTVSSETTFDDASLQFIAPVDMYSTSDALDKYLVFPKSNILV